MATAGEVLIPGDEEVLAFKAVDLLGFHEPREWIGAKSIGHRTKQENRPKNQAMILKRKIVIMITAIISLPIVPAKKPTKVPTPLLRDA
jgi:hypothetical protein